MASGTPPAWGRAWWRSTLRTLTARSSPRIGMPLPKAPKSRVRRRPLARSEWAALRPAPSSECAVRAPERRGPGPLIARLLSSAFGRLLRLSRGARDQERRGPPVALVGGAVRRPQPLLLVHGAEDDVEGDERREDGAVRRHAGQEQKEPEGSQVARVAGKAEGPGSDHLSAGPHGGALRLRLGAHVLPP